MNRAKPYKIFLMLAIIIAGTVCLLLPEKKVMPVASMSNAVKGSSSSMDTLYVSSSDSLVSE